MAIRFKLLHRLIANAKKIDRDRNKIVKKIFDESSSLKQDILDLNREDQLYDKGITADGVSLGEYSAATIEGGNGFEGKRAKGQRFDHITLKDTGEFYESFRFKAESTNFIITADTLKPDVDLLTYGRIIGLTDSNKSVVGRWILKPLTSRIKSELCKRK